LAAARLHGPPNLAGLFCKARDDAEQAWWDRYDEQKAKIADDSNLEYDIWLESTSSRMACPPARKLISALSTRAVEENKSAGWQMRHVLRWEKQHFQLLNARACGWATQTECCDTKGIAVPVGCNHRLCPLCGWHRSQKAQRRMRTMFDHLIIPTFSL